MRCPASWRIAASAVGRSARSASTASRKRRMQLRDATVLVTGASGGIGAAAARLLHERGARLVLHGRDATRLDALAESLGARVVRADLADPGAPHQLAGEAGSVDVVVHNAGVGLRAPFPDTDPDAVDRLLRINLLAPMQ